MADIRLKTNRGTWGSSWKLLFFYDFESLWKIQEATRKCVPGKMAEIAYIRMASKQDSRPPLAYFAHSLFCRQGSWKGDVFFSKKHSFFVTYSIFLNVQSFLIFGHENLIIRGENTFFGNNFIRYSFLGEFATFSDFEKNSSFFSKKLLVFQTGPKFSRFSEISLFQSDSTASLLPFGQNKFHVKKREQTCRCGVNAIGRQRVKKTFFQMNFWLS